MKRLLVAALAVAPSLSLASIAHADILTEDMAACRAKEVGQACAMPDGSAGVCVAVDDARHRKLSECRTTGPWIVPSSTPLATPTSTPSASPPANAPPSGCDVAPPRAVSGIGLSAVALCAAVGISLALVRRRRAASAGSDQAEPKD